MTSRRPYWSPQPPSNSQDVRNGVMGEVMVIGIKTNSILVILSGCKQRRNKRSRSLNKPNLIEVPLQSNDELTMNEEIFLLV